MGKTLVSWKEIQVGDFYLDIGMDGIIKHAYCIKTSDNTYFNLEENRRYTKLKVHNELPKYYICDYEVW